MTKNIIPFRPTWDQIERLLSGRKRIRRRRGPARLFERELSEGRNYPYRLKLDAAGFEVKYRWGRWTEIGEPDWEIEKDAKPERILERTLVAWVHRDGEAVAACEFAQIKIGYLVDSEILLLCDMESESHLCFAEALTFAWEGFATSTGSYGDVLELRTVWQHPSLANTDIGIRVLDRLLKKLWPRKSVLLLRAFPLEYGGMVPDGAASEVGFYRRLRAMMRMAERRLGVMPFPGEFGRMGWMWRSRPGLNFDPPNYWGQGDG